MHLEEQQCSKIYILSFLKTPLQKLISVFILGVKLSYLRTNNYHIFAILEWDGL